MIKKIFRKISYRLVKLPSIKTFWIKSYSRDKIKGPFWELALCTGERQLFTLPLWSEKKDMVTGVSIYQGSTKSDKNSESYELSNTVRTIKFGRKAGKRLIKFLYGFSANLAEIWETEERPKTKLG